MVDGTSMKFFRDRLCISLFKKKSLFPALLTHYKLNENALADVVRVSIAGGDKHDYINSFIKDSHSPRSYESSRR